jgi:lipid-binding SYLF domain-containing protein
MAGLLQSAVECCTLPSPVERLQFGRPAGDSRAASASDTDILTYGRAKGVFAGVFLGGADVEPDNDANHRLYGKTLTAGDIVRGTDVKPTADGKALVTMLDSKLTTHGK